jgi:hypothetical protein
MDNLTRLSAQLAQELQESLQRGGIYGKDGEEAQEAAIGAIIGNAVALGNALVEVAAMFDITLTSKSGVEGGKYPYVFGSTADPLHVVHEQAQFLITDVFRQGFPRQLWSHDMIRMLTTHIASKLSQAQRELKDLRVENDELIMHNSVLKARLDGFTEPAHVTQTPVAPSQLRVPGNPKTPPVLPGPTPQPQDSLITDFYLLQRQAGRTYAYYKLRGDDGVWTAKPRDGMRFTSEGEAKKFYRVRVAPTQPKGLGTALAQICVVHWTDIAEYYD